VLEWWCQHGSFYHANNVLGSFGLLPNGTWNVVANALYKLSNNGSNGSAATDMCVPMTATPTSITATTTINDDDDDRALDAMLLRSEPPNKYKKFPTKIVAQPVLRYDQRNSWVLRLVARY
jgi:hypothetical protein